jgi:hypothetical protein
VIVLFDRAEVRDFGDVHALDLAWIWRLAPDAGFDDNAFESQLHVGGLLATRPELGSG